MDSCSDTHVAMPYNSNVNSTSYFEDNNQKARHELSSLPRPSSKYILYIMLRITNGKHKFEIACNIILHYLLLGNYLYVQNHKYQYNITHTKSIVQSPM